MRQTRKMVVVLLVLTWVGQNLAAVAMPCPSATRAGMAHAVTEASGVASMAHAGHHMAGDPDIAADVVTKDCCEGGLCGMSACQSAPALPLSQVVDSVVRVTPHPGDTAPDNPFHLVDSPYRPPISR